VEYQPPIAFEVSRGSTALSLAYYSKQFELNCHLFVPENLPAEKKQQLEILGAHVHALKVEGIYDVHDEFLKKHPQCFFFNQLFDETKARHYKKLGQSFSEKPRSAFDIVIGAVGTGHSLKGVAAAHTTAVLCSAEPKPTEPCAGVRNIQNERYGEKDPCVVKNFQRRIVVDVKNFFPDSVVNTDHGQLKICESFRLVLGAILTLPASDAPRAVLAVGAQNYFSVAK